SAPEGQRKLRVPPCSGTVLRRAAYAAAVISGRARHVKEPRRSLRLESTIIFRNRCKRARRPAGQRREGEIARAAKRVVEIRVEHDGAESPLLDGVRQKALSNPPHRDHLRSVNRIDE